MDAPKTKMEAPNGKMGPPKTKMEAPNRKMDAPKTKMELNPHARRLHQNSFAARKPAS